MFPVQPVSQYRQVWNKLKAERTCSIVADVRLHSRIIKAVIKKKDLDLAHKLLCSEAGYRDKIEVMTQGTKITFTLKKIKPISVEDL